MSEEMALALANFSLASLDSDPTHDASGFLRLGSLDPEGEAASEPEPIRRVRLREDERYLSPIGWMLEMVNSSLGSSFSRVQEVVNDAEAPSASHRDPKPSPTVNGLSLYLESRTGQNVSSKDLFFKISNWIFDR